MTYLTIMERREKYCKEIETNSLIALCEIGSDYGKFCEELESLIESKKNRDLIYKIYRIMRGKFTIGKTKYKKFVRKYQDVIDIMKKHHCLSDMTILKYNPNGKPNSRSTENYFYEYISNHQEDIDTIKDVAIKIKSLGFNKIFYGEGLDFRDIEYELYTSYGHDFCFLENIEVNPTYDSNPIKYRTNGSCYCMILSTTGFLENQDLCNYGRTIELNSLIFDPNRLPDKITKDSTIDVIKQQVEERKGEYQNLQDSVNMSITTDDLINQFNYSKRMIENIENARNNEDLKRILHNISNAMTDLKNASLAFENKMIESSEKIDKSRINSEKELYLRRREAVDIDY